MKKVICMFAVSLVVCFTYVERSLGEGFIRPSSSELNFFVGPLTGDTTTEIVLGIPVEVGLDDSVTFGGRASRNFNSKIAIEGVLGISPIDTIAQVGGFTASIDTSAMFFHGNLVWHIIELKGLVPYVTVGAGMMFLLTDEPGVKSEADFTINFGGGAKYFFTETLAFRLDIRNINTKLEGTSESLNLLQITAGLSFLI